MPKRKAKSQSQTQSSNSSSSAVSVIIPNAIYLGPASSASSPTFLSSNSISHVLSIGKTPSTLVSGITYHRLPLTDSSPSSSSKLISSTISSANHIITQALESRNSGTGRGGRIYIHCAAGVSRSPTIVIGYLMKEKKMSLREAVGVVVRARPQVSPKFLRELREMEVGILGGDGGGSLDEVLGEGEELPRRREDRLAMFSLGAERG